MRKYLLLALSFILFHSCSSLKYNYSCPSVKKKGVPCKPSSEIERMIVESRDPMKEDLFIPPAKEKPSCEGCKPQNEKNEIRPQKGFQRVYVPRNGKEREYIIYFDQKDPDQFFIDNG